MPFTNSADIPVLLDHKGNGRVLNLLLQVEDLTFAIHYPMSGFGQAGTSSAVHAEPRLLVFIGYVYEGLVLF